jgi:hypothetical protein
MAGVRERGEDPDFDTGSCEGEEQKTEPFHWIFLGWGWGKSRPLEISMQEVWESKEDEIQHPA